MPKWRGIDVAFNILRLPHWRRFERIRQCLGKFDCRRVGADKIGHAVVNDGTAVEQIAQLGCQNCSIGNAQAGTRRRQDYLDVANPRCHRRAIGGRGFVGLPQGLARAGIQGEQIREGDKQLSTGKYWRSAAAVLRRLGQLQAPRPLAMALQIVAGDHAGSVANVDKPTIRHRRGGAVAAAGRGVGRFFAGRDRQSQSGGTVFSLPEDLPAQAVEAEQFVGFGADEDAVPNQRRSGLPLSRLGLPGNARFGVPGQGCVSLRPATGSIAPPAADLGRRIGRGK